MALYESLPRMRALERRTTAYRFDVDTSPAWDRIDEPGIHAPPDLLGDFGVAVDRLGDHRATFDWIYAVSVCRVFEILEEELISFLRRADSGLLPARSIAAFVEE